MDGFMNFMKKTTESIASLGKKKETPVIKEKWAPVNRVPYIEDMRPTPSRSENFVQECYIKPPEMKTCVNKTIPLISNSSQEQYLKINDAY